MQSIHDRIAESEVRLRMRALMRQHGATGVARMLGLDRQAVLGVAADAHVHEATLIVAAQRLAELEAQ